MIYSIDRSINTLVQVSFKTKEGFNNNNNNKNKLIFCHVLNVKFYCTVSIWTIKCNSPRLMLSFDIFIP